MQNQDHKVSDTDTKFRNINFEKSNFLISKNIVEFNCRTGDSLCRKCYSSINDEINLSNDKNLNIDLNNNNINLKDESCK